MLRSSKLQLHFNKLCRNRKLCYVLIALKKTPKARSELKDELTMWLGKLKHFVEKFTPSTNLVLFHNQLTYIQLYNTINWFLDDNSTVQDILGVNFNDVFDEMCNLLKVDDDNNNIGDLKDLMINIASFYTGIYYTDSSLKNASSLVNDCPCCVLDVNLYGTGRKHNICGNSPESDPELPSMTFIHKISPYDACAHMISHEEINRLIKLLKYLDDTSDNADEVTDDDLTTTQPSN